MTVRQFKVILPFSCPREIEQAAQFVMELRQQGATFVATIEGTNLMIELQ